MRIARKNADDARAHAQGMHTGNLVLKAKVVEYDEGRKKKEEDTEMCSKGTK
jgi:hypothetical protein